MIHKNPVKDLINPPGQVVNPIRPARTLQDQIDRYTRYEEEFVKEKKAKAPVIVQSEQAALIRRMDAYLSGQSCEAMAIIKDARCALSKPAASQEVAPVGQVFHALYGVDDDGFGGYMKACVKWFDKQPSPGTKLYTHPGNMD